MSKRISRKVWGVIFQDETTNLMTHVSQHSPYPLAIFDSESEAVRYRQMLLKMESKFIKKYKVVTCVLSYVEPTPKKYG